jgi:hypothetical protein
VLRRQRPKAAVDLVPIEELNELGDVLLLAIRVIDVERVLVNVTDDEQLSAPMAAPRPVSAAHFIQSQVDEPVTLNARMPRRSQ